MRNASHSGIYRVEFLQTHAVLAESTELLMLSIGISGRFGSEASTSFVEVKNSHSISVKLSFSNGHQGVCHLCSYIRINNHDFDGTTTSLRTYGGGCPLVKIQFEMSRTILSLVESVGLKFSGYRVQGLDFAIMRSGPKKVVRIKQAVHVAAPPPRLPRTPTVTPTETILPRSPPDKQIEIPVTMPLVAQNPQPRVILGLMTFGPTESKGARITSLDEYNKCLDYFQQQGFNEVDTARVYVGGEQEAFTAKAHWKERGLTLATKWYPHEAGAHKPAVVREKLEQSLKELNTNQVDIFYLHAPDRSVPFAETLEAVNELHKEGKFVQFGLSNYTAFEVAEIVTTCAERGWVRPTIFQAMYNAISK